MDVDLRYFNLESCLVETSYFDSAFIKRSNSHKFYDKLLESLSTLDLRKLLQELMDRPDKNWDVLKLHSSYREQSEFSKLTNIGSCGLHVLHGTPRTGLMETDWKINKVLHAMWEPGCDTFTLNFWKTRWVEDEPVAAWRIQIWENIVQVVKCWLSLSKSKRPRNSKSFDTLLKYHTDKLMISKLHFLNISRQSWDHFYSDLKPTSLLVVKSKVISDANNSYLLLQHDLKKNENLSDIDKVELGSAVTSAWANLKVQEEVKLKFRKYRAAIILKSIAKINERCLLKYPAVRNVVCLSPSEMIRNADPSIKRAKRLIQSLYELKFFVLQKLSKSISNSRVQLYSPVKRNSFRLIKIKTA